mmetsp:Transcript_102834/g.331374  ORF Transcript_102834/g.331374 Transcript_102834/m.331374 type:complete len:116 (+) Transcript_102834:2-349(+)
MAVVGDVKVEFVAGTRHFEAHEGSKTLVALGISGGCLLTAVKQDKPKGSCSLCFCGYTVNCDVTVGATHEGWGHRWNKCNYSCTHCFVPIQSSDKVNACESCKCFWHRKCPVANE